LAARRQSLEHFELDGFVGYNASGERRNGMSTVQARTKQKVGELLKTVKQLSPSEVHEFEERFVAWRAGGGAPMWQR
jgi:hypothetical protein